MAKVCLDAGHYGNYNRSPVVSGYYESVRMRKLTELLASELTARGIHVVKTRSNQKSNLALTSRGKKAKGCDLFVSLHSNAASAESVDYVVAYVPLNGTGTVIGKKLADCVCSVMGTAQKGRTATRQGSNGDYYGVIRGAVSVGVPGIILEHSFHTNRKATEWLLSDENLAKLAKAEADCIAEWLGVKTAPAASSKPAAAQAVQIAKHRSDAYRKTWTVKVDPGDHLNMRTGAGKDFPVLTKLKKGATFRCYGYYNLNGSTVWLYGVADGKTGFCSKNYLK